MTIKFKSTPGIKRFENKPETFIDLRHELDIFFNGDADVPGFAFDVILRHADKTQRCPCWDPLKQEANTKCGRCKGKGWLVFDKVVQTVKRKYVGKEEEDKAGFYEVDSSLFFFQYPLKDSNGYEVDLAEEDSIIEVATDDNGKIVSPIKYIKIHDIKDVEPLRGNKGRVEFLKTFARKAE
jgi:hypothetical protein